MKKKLQLLFVSLISLGILTACGGSSSPPPDVISPPPTELVWDQGNWDQLNWQ